MLQNMHSIVDAFYSKLDLCSNISHWCSNPNPNPNPNRYHQRWGTIYWDTLIGADEHQGAVSIRKTVLPGMAIPMLKIRRPNGRLIFNMEIAIRR